MGHGAKVATSACPTAMCPGLRTKVVLPDTNQMVRGGLKAETLHRQTTSETMHMCRICVFTHPFTPQLHMPLTDFQTPLHGLREAAGSYPCGCPQPHLLASFLFTLLFPPFSVPQIPKLAHIRTFFSSLLGCSFLTIWVSHKYHLLIREPDYSF